MSFQLLPDPAIESAALAQSMALDAVAIATQFDAEILAMYRASYEKLWKIGLEFTHEQLQARSNRMGPTELAILLKAGVFVQAMLSIGAPLEAKYHSPPYAYTIDNVTFADGHAVSQINTFLELYALTQVHGQFISGKLTLGELTNEWQPANSAASANE
jgi:hypothetical protein